MKIQGSIKVHRIERIPLKKQNNSQFQSTNKKKCFQQFLLDELNNMQEIPHSNILLQELPLQDLNSMINLNYLEALDNYYKEQ